MKKLKLNNAGISHIFILVGIVVCCGIMGTYLLVKSHADTFTDDASAAASLHFTAAKQKAQSYDKGSATVGFAIYSSSGNMQDCYNCIVGNSGGSITKAMLLVAYLRQESSHSLSSAAQSNLKNMIENSDNNAANWVYNHLNHPVQQINSVASDAAMSDFKLVVHPTHPYVIGESTISAADFAYFFARLSLYLPDSHQAYAYSLLSHVASSEQKGLLDAGLPGTVYSKEGWTDLDKGYPGYPYIVNQAAQFTYKGQRYGIAVTVGKLDKGSYASDEATGENIVKSITKALLGN